MAIPKRRNRQAAFLSLCIALQLHCGIARAVEDPPPIIGYVANATANPERLEIFKKGLATAGYVEGRNIVIEYRGAKLDSEYAGVMSELVARGVKVILAANAPAAVAAAKATREIPIVMAAVNDPVGLGLVESLERPGTNVTGTTNYAPQLIGERLRILKSVVPGLTKVSMFVNGNNANNNAQFQLLSKEGKALGVEVQSLDIRNPSDVPLAFERAASFRTQGLLNCVDSFINSQRHLTARLALEHKLPAILTDREYVLAGGLMALGVGHQEGYYGAAEYVAKILRGAKPAELPVALSTEFVLSVSRTALAGLDLALPESVKSRVGEWLP
jgi:putative ABC transport system substrate-binding protein